jgi:hypothetical protein
VKILKYASETAQEKADLAHALALRGRYLMTRIPEALDLARSRLIERMGNTPEKRPPRYSKEQNSVLLPFLREITDERATLGYRRATLWSRLRFWLVE